MHRPLTIFIIDDNSLFGLTLRAELAKHLQGITANVLLFEDGESCEVRDTLPDLVLVDYHLDGKNESAMNGLQVIDKIRSQSPDTDFIMITMDEKTEIFLRSREHGIYDYITKSASLPFKLSLAIQQWLKMRSRLGPDL